MLAIALSLLSLSHAPSAELPLVPLPAEIERREGSFTLGAKTPILFEAPAAGAVQAAAALLIRLRPSTGFALEARALAGDAPEGAIVFTAQGADPALGAEGYLLEVDAHGARVRASGAAGLYHGAQTLLQLLPPEVFARDRVEDVAWTIPAVRIRDQPRFAWRGLLLDVSRHFMTKDEVKRILDQMALVKLNVLHWHLVDDHGWRIAIEKFPRLTEVGAWRDAIGFGLAAKDSTAYGKDGKYGGFYTQDEIREIVSYAAGRQITIVPEIEMPGHSVAALAAYPQFSCSGGPFDRNVPAGVHAGIYCPGNEEVFGFLDDVLGEVFALFPSTFVHLGGDEVPREEWKKCAKCQARMQAEKLAGVDELQSWFLKRVEKSVNARGRRVIGWDEILEGGLAPNAAVMSWRGTQGGLAAASAGHDVVMCPNESLYLDHYQARSGEPRAIGGFSPIEEVYGYEPVPEGLPADKRAHVLGAQGNLWTEYVPNARHAEYMIWPRECAVAETGWTPREKKELAGFLARLDVHLARLSRQGVHYRAQPPAGLAEALLFASGSPPRLSLREGFAAAGARVSFDGSDPAAGGTPLSGSVPLPNGNCKVRVRLQPAGSPDSFLVEALVVQGKARATTSLGHEGQNELLRAFDLDERSFFWSDRALAKDDHVTLGFFGPRNLKHVRVASGDADKPADRFQEAVLEVLPDGGKWTEVAELKEGGVDCDLPLLPLRALRIRATAGQASWLRLHEFTIE